MSDALPRLSAALTGRYRLERELGQGGMSVVYLAQDLKHNRPVALKVIGGGTGRGLRPRRFRREIELAARLQHPHILGVHDSGESDGLLWFTMPYVRGPSLRDRLRREGRLEVAEALRITREVAQALAYAHGEGVIHRDIKPENILLTEDGVTLVADFGIARARETPDEEQLTRTGVVMGTPAYMAPEQATGEHPVDERADQYALAVVCYEMLTGTPPFTGPTAGAIIVARHVSTPPSARARRPELPTGVDEALHRALALAPGERFASVREFARTVTGASGATPTGDTAEAWRKRRPALARSGAMVLLLGILIGAGILFGWHRAREAPPPDPAPAAAPPAARVRIAVLPFESVGDTTRIHVAEGVSDAVRGKLARLPGVRVIARGSSIPYRGTVEPPERIADALGAQYLLTGTVRWDRADGGAPRVRVSPELVEVADGVPTVLWQAPFDASPTDVLQVESQIAGDVVDALRLALTGEEARALAEQPTTDPKAYEAFLKGEIASENRDLASTRRAIELYRQAVGLDSTFGLAWARLALKHAVLYASSGPSPAEAAAADSALAQARRHAPDHPGTWHARGLYHLFVANEPERALTVLDSGLTRWPQDVDLLGTAGAVDRRPERVQQALGRLRRARELDPRSVGTAVRFSFRLAQERLWDEARRVAEHGLGLAPTNLLLLQTRIVADLGEGRADAARAVLARAAATPGVDPAALAADIAAAEDLFWLLDEGQRRLVLELPPSAFDNSRATWALVRTRLHHLAGDSARARAWADTAQRAFAEEIRSAPEDPRPRVMRGVALAYQGAAAEAVEEAERGLGLVKDLVSGLESAYLLRQVALVNLLAGRPETAMDHLERLLAIRQQFSRAWLAIDPAFAALRGHPRFERIARETPA